MDVSIVIINYKSAHHVINCIRSIYDETHDHGVEIIVVDNNSEDNSKQLICDIFPQVVWVQMKYNAGFARGNNAGIKVAVGKFILLLNGDTIILDRAIDKTTTWLQQRTEAIACGVQLLNEDGSYQISGAHFKTGGLNLLLPLPYFGDLVRWAGRRFKTKIPSIERVENEMEIDWIVGAFIMVRSDILRLGELLDEDFFMYAEEIEWCSRLKQHGKLYLLSVPKVVHLGGGASGDYYKTDENQNSKNLWNKKGAQILVSQFLRIRKQYGIFWLLILTTFFLLEIPVFAAGLLVSRLAATKGKHNSSQLLGYIKNMRLVVTYLPKIIKNRPYFYKVY